MKQTFILSTLLVLLAACGEHPQPSGAVSETSAVTTATENGIATAATSNPDSLPGKDAYVNPIDKNTYVSEKGWKTYHPEGGVKWDAGSVQMEKIILLTDQQILTSLISIDSLGDYVNGIRAIVLKQLANVKEKGEVMIQYTLYAGKKPNIRLSYKGSLQEQPLLALKDKIDVRSKDIRTMKDSCVFQVLYSVNERVVK